MDQSMARLRRSLSVMPWVKARVEDAIRAVPGEGSLARADSAVPFGKGVSIFSGQSLTAASDHLLAWHIILEARFQPGFAHMTLLRSALEGAVRCRWLVDPEASSAERGRRGALAHLEDLVEKRRFVGSVDPSPEARRMARRTARWERATRRAIAAQGWMDARINVADLFDLYGDGAWTWRLTSSFAHAREWALTSGDHTEKQERAGEPTVVRTVASGSISANITAHAVAKMNDALVAYASYHGVSLTSGRPEALDADEGP